MDPQPIVTMKPSKPVVWKVLVGVLLIYVNLNNLLSPAPNLLKAETSTEQLGMNIACYVMIGVGCWLIYSGAKPLWQKASK